MVISIEQYTKRVKLEASLFDPMSDPLPYDVRDWSSVMRHGGYHCVVANDRGDWSGMHRWLEKNIGRDHYSWNGNNFWFETTKDATWFALNWS